MKVSGSGPKGQMVKKVTAVVFVLILLFFGVTGLGLASSGEEGGTKGWVATDTYRVMNFTVLFVALFLLLRKPTAQALNARIKGIKEQLDELETKKKEAEKQLTVYNEKFAQLEQEAEKLIEEYIRQGNDAKARILAEADSQTLVLGLLSGGGSALMPSPAPGILLEEKQEITTLLLKAGASINELNAIRKHLSNLKGGKTVLLT